jgi:hypothetical protein
MQRHQPCLPKLCAADGQYPGLEIDIVQLKVTRVAEAQPRDAQEPQQTRVDPRTQLTALIAAWHGARGAHEAPNLLIRIQVGSRPLRTIRQQAVRRNLGPGIEGATIARENPHHAQATRPFRRLYRVRLLRPRERQPRRDGGGPVLLHERDKLG